MKAKFLYYMFRKILNPSLVENAELATKPENVVKKSKNMTRQY